MDKFVILSGPTGVGKTSISIKLAKIMGGEIISCDSMQIYKGMDIGSAKIKKEEMCEVPHHLIDFLDPKCEYSVASYQKEAKKLISSINKRNKIPILTGGTGLYIDSIINDYSFTSVYKDEEYRDYLFNLAKEKGNQYVHLKLKERDFKSYNSIHPNNIKRVVRALEVYHVSGKAFSEFDNIKYNNNYKFLYFVLTMERKRLYDRINCRVDSMMEEGLLDEVIKLRDSGLTSNMQSMKGIGYKELLYYLDGHIGLNEAIDNIKQGTRNYAKRQLTWFRRDNRVIWVDKDEYIDENSIIDHIVNCLNSNDFREEC